MKTEGEVNGKLCQRDANWRLWFAVFLETRLEVSLMLFTVRSLLASILEKINKVEITVKFRK